MKKIYALLLGLLAFACLAFVPAAEAQYSVTDYVVRANHNTFVSIAGQGTTMPELLKNAPYNYYWVTNEETIPFNYRFVNLVTNKFKVESDGTVICGGSASWPDAAYYDFGQYGGYGIYYSQNYYGSYYGYYANQSIRPFSGYGGSTVGLTEYTYAVQGTAPNRTCTIEVTAFANYYQFNNHVSMQVVLYEVSANSGFISKIDLNYGPTDNSNNWSYGYSTGIKDAGYCNGEISIYDPIDPGTGGTPTFTTCGFYQNSLPPKFNMTFSILYDYNLSWSKPNNTPADNKILLINQPIVNPAVTPFVNGPSIYLSNEGRLGGYSAVKVNLQITGDPTNPYNNSVDLTAAQLATLTPFGGVSSIITFPNYTPVNYGIYTMTWTVKSSTPADQFTPDNTLVTSFIISPPNNIAAIKALIPVPNSRSPINIPSPISFEFRNLGVNDQTGVPVTVQIKNPNGVVVYRDTQILNNWLSSQIRDTTFKDFTPTQNGDYIICGISLLSNDQAHYDDTVCTPFKVRYEADVAALSIFVPDDQQEMPEKKQFKVGGYFQSVGARDLFNVPVRVQMKRCSDNTLVYQADTLLPELNIDAGPVKMYFPAQVGNGSVYNTANLAPGCYQVCIIAREADDGDRSNDTACSYFAVIPRLEGNINVGIGQRFQTISAAVDSMRFRGVGGVKFGYLNLILTDANYTENGNTSVSTASSAIDFADITGAGPTNETGKPTVFTINWKPKKGVSPVITFSGSKQYCFSITYRSTNYMTFDGNNQFSPTADLATPEPAKRGITVINNSTFAGGAVFDFEFGRHDIVLKNLKVRGNGNLSNANSFGIHTGNIYTQQTFLSGIHDTLPNHHLTIDNVEVSNAAIGIFDVGTIPLFDINQAIFFDKRNHDNRITRNTIGTQAFPIGILGIQTGNEDGLYIGHNEISSVQGFAGSSYGGGIAANSGNSVNLWIDANKVHNVRSSSPAANTLVGIDVQQLATIYTQGQGVGQRRSTLPLETRNRITNNMIYDFRYTSLPMTTISPIAMSTAATNYFVDRDSIFNNSLSVSDAPAMITLIRSQHPFLWNNILQNTNASANTNAVVYDITLTRPMLTSVNSNYNDFNLLNSTQFATLREYDMLTGTYIQTRNIKSLDEWRYLTHQDISSVTGDPMFSMDSLHLPPPTSYILSPAANNGAWLNTQTQRFDFDGNERLVRNNTPNIGATDGDVFQLANDLSVQVITKPNGITDNAGVINVTAENPLAIQAIIKNQGSIQAFNRNAYSKIEVSTDGGATWNLYFAPGSGSPMSTLSGLHFDVAETKTLDFIGPNISNEAGKLFRVTVWVDPDQNNANNSLSKVFKLLVKRAAVLLSYENSTAQGQMNKDSLAMALQRLGIPYDSLNRVTYGSAPIDYTPWWTMIWSTGNPGTAYNQPLGVGAISLKEEEEIINFFRAGQTWAKKSFVIAGENIAMYNDPTSIFYANQNVITDKELMTMWLHTQFIARWPGLNWPAAAPIQYRGLLNGVGSYFRFADSILSYPSTLGGGPNVIKVNPSTGTVGDNISRVAYTYAIHPQTPLDSGAGTAWTGSTFNVVFYPFDWSDPLQTSGTMDNQALPVNVSGTTRFLRGALDFIQSFRGTVLPVEFTDVKGSALKTGNEITWSVAAQKSVDHYEVEMLTGTDWNWVGQTKASSATAYSFMHTASAAFEVGKTFTYRIVSVDLDGARAASMTTSFGRTADGVLFSLDQNFPNPFNPATVLGFTLPTSGNVSLRILDMTGKVIATPVNGVDYSAGKASVKFDASNLASGTYVYELSFVNANGELSKLSRKMTLNK